MSYRPNTLLVKIPNTEILLRQKRGCHGSSGPSFFVGLILLVLIQKGVLFL